MNLFTVEQIGRMTTVLENSPRRASLLSSHGLSDPVPLANDLGIREVISPLDGECSSLVTPIIEVRNYGSNLVSSTRITLTIDGVLVETKDFTYHSSFRASVDNIKFFTYTICKWYTYCVI